MIKENKLYKYWVNYYKRSTIIDLESKYQRELDQIERDKNTYSTQVSTELLYTLERRAFLKAEIPRLKRHYQGLDYNNIVTGGL